MGLVRCYQEKFKSIVEDRILEVVQPTRAGTMWRAKDPASDVFQNWHKSQPGNEAGNECCLAMSFSDGKWHDVPCNADYNAVCKYIF